MREMEDIIADFVQIREKALAELPPARGPRALLVARMAEAAESAAPASFFDWLWRRVSTWRALTAAASLGVIAAALLLTRPSAGVRLAEDSVPDPRITPGAVLPLTRADVCAAGMVESARLVPADVARQVFAAYGIQHPEPRAYEVDYLITPALGGSDHIQNFWPQPYGNTVWNAHVKDALEDRLRRMVCQGELELSVAQQELAQNWIAAYKKYFRTDRPLQEHAAFLKDRPWE